MLKLRMIFLGLTGKLRLAQGRLVKNFPSSPGIVENAPGRQVKQTVDPENHIGSELLLYSKEMNIEIYSNLHVRNMLKAVHVQEGNLQMLQKPP